MKIKLPKQIFVTIDNEGTRDEYLNANATPDEAAEMGVQKRGGVYVLKELINIRGVTEVSPVSVKRKR